MPLNLGVLTVQVGADISQMVQGFQQAQAVTRQLETQFGTFQKTTSGLLVPTKTLSNNLTQTAGAAEQAAGGIDKIRRPAQNAHNEVKTLTDRLTNMSNRIHLMFGGVALSAAFTMPFIALGKASLDASIGFESAFAGVRKTMDATEQEFQQLQDRFRGMATEMPATAEQFARIGELAGQLGVRGVDNVTEFTDVVSKLGVTTNLSFDEAATSLARFANIMQMPLSEVDRLGSTIVDLGNNFATTEAEIVEFGLRIAGAGKQIGLSEAQVLAFGAALSSVGIKAEAGGTAISRVFMAMANAVANGGEELEKFATVANMSADQFAHSFRTNAAAATTSFVEGLRRIQVAGGNVFAVLEDLDQTEQRVIRTLLSTAGAGDLLRNSLELAANAWEDNNALNIEATKRFATTAAQIQVAKNNFTELARTIGDIFLPQIRALSGTFKTLTQNLTAMPDALKLMGVGIFALLAAIGPVMLALTIFGASLGGLKALLLSFGASSATIAAVTAGFNIVVLAIAALAAAAFLVWKNWDSIGPKLSALWERLAAFGESAAIKIEIAWLKMGKGINRAVAAISWGDFKKDADIALTEIEARLEELATAAETNAARVVNAQVQMQAAFAEKDPAAHIYEMAQAAAFAQEELNKLRSESTYELGVAAAFASSEFGQLEDNLIQLKRVSLEHTQVSEEAAKKAKEMAEIAAAAQERMAESTRTANQLLANAVGDNWRAMSDQVTQTYKQMTDGVTRIGDGLTTALKRQAEERFRAEELSINGTLASFQRLHDEKMRMADQELTRELATIDSALSADLEWAQKQLDAINEREKLEEFHRRKFELGERIINAKITQDKADTEEERVKASNDRIKAEQALAEFLHRHEVDLQREGLRNFIETRRTEAEAARQTAKEKAEAERKAAQDMLAEAKTAAQQRLDSAKVVLAEETKAWKLEADARKLIVAQNQSEITQLLQSYAPEWQNAGLSFGQRLAMGLQAAMPMIESQVQAIMGLMRMTERAQSNLQRSVQNITLTETTPTGGTIQHNIPVLTEPPKPPARIQVPIKPAFMATGGIVTRPTLGVVGEAGPEAVIPLRRNTLASAGVAPQVNITIQVSNNTLLGSDTQMASELARLLVPELRRRLSLTSRVGIEVI